MSALQPRPCCAVLPSPSTKDDLNITWLRLPAALQEPGLPRDIKNTLGAFCEGLWSILVWVWVWVGFLAAMCICASLSMCLAGATHTHPTSAAGQQSPRLFQRSGAPVHRWRETGGVKTFFCCKKKNRIVSGWGWGGGCIHTNMLINRNRRFPLISILHHQMFACITTAGLRDRLRLKRMQQQQLIRDQYLYGSTTG